MDVCCKVWKRYYDWRLYNEVGSDDWIEKDWVNGLVKYSSFSKCNIYYGDVILRDTINQCFDTAMNKENGLISGSEIEYGVISVSPK